MPDASSQTARTLTDGVVAAAPGDGAGTPRRDHKFDAQIDQLELDPVQRAYLSERVLGELAFLGKRARRAQRHYYVLRLVTILGGVAIPALVGLEMGDQAWTNRVRWLVFGLGLVVASAAALEEFFRWGERWRHYRRQAELLRGEGWAYLTLSGPTYQQFDSHAAAFRTFVAATEEAIRQEVGVYITQITRAPEREKPTDNSPTVDASTTASTSTEAAN
jgi:hypothetical protein